MKLEIPCVLLIILSISAVLFGIVVVLPRGNHSPAAATVNIGTNILILAGHDYVMSITNRAWLKMADTIIVRVTDSEWAILTNAFPKHLRTNTLNFER